MKFTASSDKFLYGTALLVSLVLFILVVLRAVYVPPIEDELTTFYYYIRTGGFQPFHAELDANNHVVNSALSHIFYRLFGDGLLAIRMANVLSFIVYLLYIFRFSKFFGKKYLWLLWMLCLTAPIYIISLFSLSRGYGLSLAFLTATLYHLMDFFKFGTNRAFYLGLIMVSLALWSNLALMVTVLIIGMLFGLIHIRNGLMKKPTREKLKAFGGFLVLFGLPLAYAILYTFELRAEGKLYHGSDGEFWMSCGTGVMMLIVGHWNTAEIALAGILILYGFVLMKNLRSNPEVLLNPINITLWGSVLGILLLHYLFGVNYPTDRAVIHLYPLLIIAWFWGLENEKGRWIYIPAMLFAILIGTYSVSAVNLKNTTYWSQESIPKEFYQSMVDWKALHGKTPVVSGRSFTLAGLEYFDYKAGGNLNIVAEPKFPNPHADFLIINEKENNRNIEYFDTLFYDADATLGLLRRKTPNLWSAYSQIETEHFESRSAYFSMAHINVNDLQSVPVRFDVKFTASAVGYLHNWRLVYSLKRKDKSDLEYYKVNLLRTYPEIAGKKLIESAYVFESLSADVEWLDVYVWNVGNENITISNSEVVVSGLKSNLEE